MYEIIIKEYINKLTTNDIKKYAFTNNIYINDDETEIIYNFIINYWKNIYRTKDISIINKLKGKINNEAYNSIVNLVNKYKNKY